MFFSKACKRCKTGDLYDDFDEFVCYQCGERYLPLSAVSPAELVEVTNFYDDGTPRARIPRRTYKGNSAIDAKARSEARWLEKNKFVIDMFRRGLTVAEVAAMTGQGGRQLREIMTKTRELDAIERREENA